MDDKTWDLVKTFGGWLSGGAIGACITLTVTWLRGRRQRILVGKTVTYMDVSKIPGDYKTEIVFRPKEDHDTSTEYTVNILAILKIEFKNPSNKDFNEFTAQVNLDKKHQIIAVESVGSDKLHIVHTTTPVSINDPKDEYQFHLKPFNRRDTYEITFLIDAKERDVIKGLEIGRDQPVKFINADTSRFITEMILMFFSVALVAFAAIRQKHLYPSNNPTDYLVLSSQILSTCLLSIVLFRKVFTKGLYPIRKKR